MSATSKVTLDLGAGDVATPSAMVVAPTPGGKAKKKKRGKKPSTFRVRADIVQGGRLTVRHMDDGSTEVYLPPVALTADSV